jgi:hypothetical protein
MEKERKKEEKQKREPNNFIEKMIRQNLLLFKHLEEGKV